MQIDFGSQLAVEKDVDRNFARRRIAALASLLVVAPAVFWMQDYRGSWDWWLNDYASPLLQIVFWCLVGLALWPKRTAAANIAWVVWGAACALELMRLYDDAWAPLEAVRETRLGGFLLETTFDPGRLPCYIVGAVLAWAWMVAICALWPIGQPQRQNPH